MGLPRDESVEDLEFNVTDGLVTQWSFTGAPLESLVCKISIIDQVV